LTAAIFGLVGVLVGGALTTGASFVFERRREKRLTRVGLQLLEAEFLKVAGVLYAALEEGVWVAGSDLEVATWPDYRAALAAELARDDFNFVALAVHAAYMAPKHFAVQLSGGALVVDLSDRDRKSLNEQLDSIQRAQVVIARQLGVWPTETRERAPEIPRDAFPPRPSQSNSD
jgi:hypothetical protein